MELQQMRYVVAVAQERSFTRAAERCHVVQSALSHQVKALERELGVTLFARSSRRVEPTAAGEAFVAAARASLDAADRAIADAAAASGQIQGTLNVGAIPTVTAIDLPSALAAFRSLHPAVRIGVRTAGSDEFLTAIAQGSLDVALLGLPEERAQRGIAMRTLARERHVAVVGSAHPLAGRAGCRLSDLADSTFVDFPPGTPGRAQSDVAFERAGLRREVAFEAMNLDLILGLVRSGLAVALLPPGLIPETGDLCTIPLADGPTRVQCLAWSDFNATPAARAFVEGL
ncbi:LysR family transcriptional regulator [Microbacterium bovistercoris]|uniref:LysR family transcriptional regulator n=1 Tax=Microbacterium bovistercoris TaxID=2293570 RepID=A0A371NSY0_9MICO|nr:LysR family transcriptional regulator [Microbacterium bovistercoris]REJ05413.1 LysR family transcriptional regulator [Microbacterium bovistercoris]